MKERITVTLDFRGKYKAYSLEVDIPKVHEHSVINYLAQRLSGVGADLGYAMLAGEFPEVEPK